jgi:hypothetical protein
MVRSRATTAAIARLTDGMVPVSLQSAELAPRVCGSCRGAGVLRGGAVCAFCAGAGTTRRLLPGDAANVVVAQGPCGLGQQQLIAVALADGRRGLLHLCGCEQTLYVPAAPSSGEDRARSWVRARSATPAVGERAHTQAPVRLRRIR